MKTKLIFLLLSSFITGSLFLDAQDLKVGDYYALIIGVDNYSGDWEVLSNAVRDAKTLEQTLEQHYKFDYFRALINEEASRENIINAFEWLMSTVTEDDNVLIYYTGHGDYNSKLDAGFWVPADAQSSSVSGLISNTDVITFIKGIKSRHTLLISDACFTGDIFRGQAIQVEYEDSPKYYEKVHQSSSRKAITSGGIEPVLGGGSDGHSVFAFFLLRALMKNENKYFDATQLYNNVWIPVANNSEQTPQFHPLKNTGDAGGQFVFVKKGD